MTNEIYKELPRGLFSLWGQLFSHLSDTQKVGFFEEVIQRTMIYRQLLDNNGVRPKGILYLGANSGQLLWIWLQLGFSKVLMVEPLERVFKQLQHTADLSSRLMLTYDHFTGLDKPTQIHVAQCAVGDDDGEAELFQTANSHFASLLEPSVGNVGDVDFNLDKGFELVDKVTVPLVKIDSLVQAMGPEETPDEYNALYMNIQGAELKALQGATKQLEKLEFILLENNFVARYDGCPTADEIHDYLADFGFRPVWGHKNTQKGNGFTAYCLSK